MEKMNYPHFLVYDRVIDLWGFVEKMKWNYAGSAIHCEARSKYNWDHAICKVYIDNKWWVVPDGRVMDIPWEYEAVKKSCYDFILP